MGNDFLICEKCGYIYDSYGCCGHTDEECKRYKKKNKGKIRKMNKRFHELGWETGYISQKVLKYFDSFWEHAENVINNPDRNDSNIEYSIRFVNSFLYGGGVERERLTSEEHDNIIQSQGDIKQYKACCANAPFGLLP
jgi:hypothetical protein